MKRMLVLGLGRATKNVVKYLLSRDDEVFAYEEKPLERIDPELSRLVRQQRVKMLKEVAPVDEVITSPGFAETSRIIQAIRRQRLPLIDEIEFTYRLLPANIIAVTGTNGKSTTTALIAHILNAAGQTVFLGGNLAPGRPFSAALFERPYDYYALEVSTFQLERADQFRPRVAVLTNITADHLDRHAALAEYIDLKFRIFANQHPEDLAVVNYDDPRIKPRIGTLRARVIPFSTSAKVDGIYCNGQDIVDQSGPVMPVSEIGLPGRHNVENVLAAVGVALELGLDRTAVRNAVRSFRGLPHRLEWVAEVEGVKYINNSMCTNPSAAIASLKAVPGPKIVILGGQEKNLSSTEYLDLVTKTAKAAVIIGANRNRIADYFRSAGYADFELAQDMGAAVRLARARAQAGDTVLLNPGYASFGDFRDFEERGEVFKNAVRKA